MQDRLVQVRGPRPVGEAAQAAVEACGEGVEGELVHRHAFDLGGGRMRGKRGRRGRHGRRRHPRSARLGGNGWRASVS